MSQRIYQPSIPLIAKRFYGMSVTSISIQNQLAVTAGFCNIRPPPKRSLRQPPSSASVGIGVPKEKPPPKYRWRLKILSFTNYKITRLRGRDQTRSANPLRPPLTSSSDAVSPGDETVQSAAPPRSPPPHWLSAIHTAIFWHPAVHHPT